MNLVRRISLISIMTALAFAFFAAQAPAQNVTTDYDHSVNFSQFHTYSWGQVRSSDPLFEQRIRDAVDRVLQAKGWQQTQSGGDVTVDAAAFKKNKAQYTTFYNGLGGGWGWRGWGGMGMATTNVQNIPIGTLVVDMYDTNSKRLVWRGMAHDTLSNKPEKNSKKLDKAVEKMLKKFPPKSS